MDRVTIGLVVPAHHGPMRVVNGVIRGVSNGAGSACSHRDPINAMKSLIGSLMG